MEVHVPHTSFQHEKETCTRCKSTQVVYNTLYGASEAKSMRTSLYHQSTFSTANHPVVLLGHEHPSVLAQPTFHKKIEVELFLAHHVLHTPHQHASRVSAPALTFFVMCALRERSSAVSAFGGMVLDLRAGGTKESGGARTRVGHVKRQLGAHTVRETPFSLTCTVISTSPTFSFARQHSTA